mgnify:CR=1 FL=1
MRELAGERALYPVAGPRPKLPGVATALKILFSSRDCGSSETDSGLPPLELERNEVIALVNLLARFSSSLNTYRRLSGELLRQEPGLRPAVASAAPVA